LNHHHHPQHPRLPPPPPPHGDVDEQPLAGPGPCAVHEPARAGKRGPQAARREVPLLNAPARASSEQCLTLLRTWRPCGTRAVLKKCAIHSNTCIPVRAVCVFGVLIRVQRELMSGVSRRFPAAWPWRYSAGVLIGSTAQADVWGSPPFAQREQCGCTATFRPYVPWKTWGSGLRSVGMEKSYSYPPKVFLHANGT